MSDILRVRACLSACPDVLRPVYVRFAAGTTVYSVRTARSGRLEKLVIRSYEIDAGRKTGNQPVVSYTDTLNWKWSESDLCDFKTAVELALAANVARLKALSDC